VASIINSFAISGVNGYLVEVEIKTIEGKPSVTIVGLGDASVKEASERLQASLNEAGYEFPKIKVVINLAPGNIKKSGSHFDLSMAIGLLLQSEQITIKAPEQLHTTGFLGELSLNGAIKACRGVLPMVEAARCAGLKTIIVPMENLKEAQLVKGVYVLGFSKLHEVVAYLSSEKEYVWVPEQEQMPASGSSEETGDDFKDVVGQDALMQYIVVAAAGGHNMLMIGSPGCGKSMVARRIPSILPTMSEEESLEVTKIYSIAGLMQNSDSLILERPFRAPHHNASTNSLVGGGARAIPGEITLAHNGVLFLDEIAEFSKKSLETLRQPMEDNYITISRVNQTNTYPCNFMLVAAMNPCPCGYYGASKCHCSDYKVLQYRQKISGPIMDRMDIQKNLQPVNFLDLPDQAEGFSSAELREKVELARAVQRSRFAGIPGVNCNAQMSPAQVKEFCPLDNEIMEILRKAYERFHYSARTYHKFIKLARTLADLEGSKQIRRRDMAAALLARDLERDRAGMMVV